VHPDNVASRRVLEKLGMTATGPACYFEVTLLRYTISNTVWQKERPADP
jgi:RimJ/RimL family protein N-acetyltransferase